MDALAYRLNESSSVTQSIEPYFLKRWSGRAFADKPVTAAQVEQLIEAARWAPSCFNAQPWRFGFALRGTDAFVQALSALVEGNQIWAKDASVLMAVVSRTTYEHNEKDAPTHSFDAGAAWMSLALQASAMGLVSHAMAGYDPASASAAWQVPSPYVIEAIIAVGYPGNPEDLPEALRARELPAPRKDLKDVCFKDSFSALKA